MSRCKRSRVLSAVGLIGWIVLLSVDCGGSVGRMYGQDRLTDGLLDEVGEVPREPSAKRSEAAGPEGDRMGLTPSEVEGEVGLSRIEAELKESVRSLMRGDASMESVARQKRILEGFDRLIRAVDESQRASAGSVSKAKRASRELSADRESASKVEKMETSMRRTEETGNRGTERGEGNEQGRAEADRQMKEVQMNALEAYQQRVWGHLPQRLRKQFESAPLPRFLPSYRQGIEEYYRRLNQEGPNR